MIIDKEIESDCISKNIKTFDCKIAKRETNPKYGYRYLYYFLSIIFGLK